MHTAVAPAPPPAAARPDAPARRTPWAWAGLLGGAGILAVLLWRLGTGPFLDGVRQLDGRALAAALGLGLLTTVCCAWRWSLVAGGLGLRLPLPTALAACYRSVFLNATLPGGVLGDVDRAVHSGRAAGDVGRGIRSVVWDRTAGQVVQAVLAVLVLLALPSPVRSAMPAVSVAALGVALAVLVLSRPGVSGWVRAVQADLRAALLAPRTRVPIVLASAVAVSGHVATFLVAARVAGATASVPRLVPLALLALLAMAAPLNVAGFGPREGVAAWAFGAGGLTAAQGVATGVAYGVLVLVASLPGAAVLLIGRPRD
ncbi:MAG: lysylphosphatidylglycerol synthase transmembrane domain-containing protein [Mycobacteriales bacterium]